MDLSPKGQLVARCPQKASRCADHQDDEWTDPDSTSRLEKMRKMPEKQKGPETDPFAHPPK